MAQSGRQAVLHVSDDDTTYLRVGNLSGASESPTSALEDRNIIGVNFQSRAALMRDRGISGSGYYDPANPGQLAIRNALLNKTKVFTRFWPLGSDGRKQLCVVSSFEIAASTGGLTTVSFQLDGAGAKTKLAGAATALAATEQVPFSGRQALIKAIGTPTAMTDEATTSNGAYTVYTITDAAKRVISPYAAYTVELNTVAVTSGITINRLLGTVTFAAANIVSDTVTITGTYLPRVTIADASEWSLSISNNSEDASVLGDQDMKRENTLGDVTGSISRFHVSDAFMDLMDAQNPIILEFFVTDPAAVEARCWAYLGSVSVDPQATSLITEAIDFSGTIDNEGNSIAFLT